MTMLTTIQVRKVIRKNGGAAGQVYTNKYKIGNERTVKCYYNGNDAMLAALKAACGEENVKLTAGSGYSRSWGEGIIVKCVIA